MRRINVVRYRGRRCQCGDGVRYRRSKLNLDIRYIGDRYDIGVIHRYIRRHAQWNRRIGLRDAAWQDERSGRHINACLMAVIAVNRPDQVDGMRYSGFIRNRRCCRQRGDGVRLQRSKIDFDVRCIGDGYDVGVIHRYRCRHAQWNRRIGLGDAARQSKRPGCRINACLIAVVSGNRPVQVNGMRSIHVVRHRSRLIQGRQGIAQRCSEIDRNVRRISNGYDSCIDWRNDGCFHRHFRRNLQWNGRIGLRNPHRQRKRSDGRINACLIAVVSGDRPAQVDRMRRVTAVRQGSRLRQQGQGRRQLRSVNDFDIGCAGNRSDGRLHRAVPATAITAAVAAIPATIAAIIAARSGSRRTRRRIVDCDDNAFRHLQLIRLSVESGSVDIHSRVFHMAFAGYFRIRIENHRVHIRIFRQTQFRALGAAVHFKLVDRSALQINEDVRRINVDRSKRRSRGDNPNASCFFVNDYFE